MTKIRSPCQNSPKNSTDYTDFQNKSSGQHFILIIYSGITGIQCRHSWCNPLISRHMRRTMKVLEVNKTKLKTVTKLKTKLKRSRLAVRLKAIRNKVHQILSVLKYYVAVKCSSFHFFSRQSHTACALVVSASIPRPLR